MTSWFPLFIPVEAPQTVRAGQSVRGHFWRCVDKQMARVWYEWAVEAPLCSKVHNVCGSRSSIGLL
jgi:protein arginine N-methyltransferase 5